LYRVDDHQFFIVIMVIGSPASGLANPNFGGEMFDLGKQQRFCLGRRFSKHKITIHVKICSAWPPG